MFSLTYKMRGGPMLNLDRFSDDGKATIIYLFRTLSESGLSFSKNVCKAVRLCSS
jgi:hypothetical protein